MAKYFPVIPPAGHVTSLTPLPPRTTALPTTPHDLKFFLLPLPVHGVSPIITLAPWSLFQQQSPRAVMETPVTVFVPDSSTSRPIVHHAWLRLGSVIEHAPGTRRALYPDCVDMPLIASCVRYVLDCLGLALLPSLLLTMPFNLILDLSRRTAVRASARPPEIVYICPFTNGTADLMMMSLSSEAPSG